MKKFCIFMLLVFAFFLARGQSEIGTGTWRTHLNYSSAERIEIAGSKVYCATDNGIFYYDTDDNSFQKLSKLNGLSDTGVGALKYLKNEESLVLGYKKGNLDIIKKDGTINLPGLKRSSFDAGRKNITHIIEKEGLLYLSTGLGVIVVDLNNHQIKESYRTIGPSAQEVVVHQTEFFNDSIFVASNIGLLSAPFNASVNLMDFNNWTLHNNDPVLPAGPISGILKHKDYLVAYTQEQIFIHENGWSLYDFTSESLIKNVNSSEDALLISLGDSLLRIENNVVQIFSEGISSAVYSIEVNDELWVADRQMGLLRYQSGSFIPIVPNGPYSASGFNFISREKGIIVAGGGYSRQFTPSNSINGFYWFQKGQWQNFNAKATGNQKIPDVQDLVGGDSFDRHTYLASFGSGILRWDEDGSFEVFDENTSGSTLQRNDNNKLLITDVKSGDTGLWILNYGNVLSLHEWNGAGLWHAYNIGSAFPFELLNTSVGQKWMIIDPGKGGGIIVFNPEKELSRRLSTARGSGGLPSNEVTALAEDFDGEIWVGTASGLVFYPQPYLSLENDNGTYYAYDATFPIVENDIFLRDIRINDILIDPGNKKWIATDEGIWVAEGNGGDLILNFNEDNSPLLSNKVLKMEIVGETGEIFFLTDKGMISYRADVSYPDPDYSDVKIFPNPVYARHSGIVTISGLKNNSIIKITDSSGRLIWETRSSGGTAIWNTAASSLKTGVFLVFSSDSEAVDKYVGKIAVVR